MIHLPSEFQGHCHSSTAYNAKIAEITARETAAGWQEVSEAEIDAVCKGRAIFNGCTSVYLDEHYGEGSVKHVGGLGWFRRAEALVS